MSFRAQRSNVRGKLFIGGGEEGEIACEKEGVEVEAARNRRYRENHVIAGGEGS